MDGLRSSSGNCEKYIHKFREETPNATELLRIPSIQGEPHACTTGWYVAITLTAFTQTSTKKNVSSFKLSTGLLPDDGSCVNRNMSEQVL